MLQKQIITIELVINKNSYFVSIRVPFRRGKSRIECRSLNKVKVLIKIDIISNY